jgi:MOSC domain-containing protein YiiM
VGDEQADRRHHGGVDMAVHCYPIDHHEAWRASIGEHPLLDELGSFGSNLAIPDLTEEQVCIGDRVRLGTALVEVSQPRKPCATIERHFGVKGMVAAIIENGWCGWYYRVLEPGKVEAGDKLSIVDRPNPDWDISKAFFASYGKRRARKVGQELARVPGLAADLAAKLR